MEIDDVEDNTEEEYIPTTPISFKNEDVTYEIFSAIKKYQKETLLPIGDKLTYNDLYDFILSYLSDE